ncbi:hydantoinase/oxoprolinase family protein [Bordetella sp. BOR01]|uniref:hydantoinase/oxoprolinase family protein n=1 Tax=Bordetella sp. BOR01 TaxID=2854779 RepID=UPI001C496AB8|nr:hydantoinase/oxoprolinase family protein [Bordetella sp. BOR01]MBV7481588.1 hydantoinase/oxoprolinase family protein [Bordetella sp. BOR01]
MAVTVGIDVGGTFTDLILVDDVAGTVKISKVPSTVDNQAYGVLEALRRTEVPLSRVSSIVHGTTTTTNAVLERKLAKVGLITTEGFRDILELGRRTRPHAYGLTGSFVPLIPRELRREVTERMDAQGRALVPLDEAAFVAVVRELAGLGVEALVIHFLHSYANPAHEQRALELAREHWPNQYITAGHAIISEFREFERGTAAAVNASVQPILDRYIDHLQESLSQAGFGNDLLVMQGNGGTVSARTISRLAINTVMSGPASGVMAAAYSGRLSGYPNLVTYDMGGTSSDVALIENGVPKVSSELELEYGMPLHVPMVDVHTVGAGGGSIARVQAGGLLRVGPDSAGAHPGPICYGRGGELPTLTDANLVLGRLDPQRLLAVDRAVSVDEVAARIEATIGKPLGLDAVQAAAAILQIGNNNMAGAVRLVSLARGYDPRDFALFAFGGAGPLHAVALARELAIPTVLIPVRPGLTNALGCLVADVRHDFVKSFNRPLKDLSDAALAACLREQVSQGHEAIMRDGIAVSEVQVFHHAQMQFQGQSHLLTVPLDPGNATVAQLQEAFARAYWQRFQVELSELRPVLVTLDTSLVGKRQGVALDSLRSTGSGHLAPRYRSVWFAGSGWVDTPIYARENVPPEGLAGPAIVEQLDATIVIEPGTRARGDDHGNLIISL